MRYFLIGCHLFRRSGRPVRQVDPGGAHAGGAPPGKGSGCTGRQSPPAGQTGRGGTPRQRRMPPSGRVSVTRSSWGSERTVWTLWSKSSGVDVLHIVAVEQPQRPSGREIPSRAADVAGTGRRPRRSRPGFFSTYTRYTIYFTSSSAAQCPRRRCPCGSRRSGR